MSEVVNYNLNGTRILVERLKAGYMEMMLTTQLACEEGHIDKRFAANINTLVSECFVRLQDKLVNSPDYEKKGGLQ